MIPCDQLYNYILNLVDHRINLYFFSDFHSKSLDEAKSITWRSARQRRLWPVVICHDQELLEYDRFNDQAVETSEIWQQHQSRCVLPNLNLKWLMPINIHDSFLITHSEKNSEQVSRYQDAGFEMVYFWSHGLIARDWYRYAQHDPRVQQPDHVVNKDWLIYSRGWQGTREYRLKMLELLSERDLIDQSLYSIGYEENDCDIARYQIQDPRFQTAITQQVRDLLPMTQATGNSSADYDVTDFDNTNFSLVMETVFASSTIHLTEKILRAIAMKHPFILAAAPHSLKYLRDYGFKTFRDCGVDESYDDIQCPLERLRCIADEMKRISDLPREEKSQLVAKCRAVAQENHQHFFSDRFYQGLLLELRDNLQTGLDRVRHTALGRTFLASLVARRRLHGQEYHRERVRARKSYIRDCRAFRKRTMALIKNAK